MYDVIIVGAGPAGCVLASRLSEVTDRRVLLVESGADATPGAEHPEMLDPFPLAAATNPAFHWPGLVSDWDDGQSAVKQRRPLLQARGVGGASNINGMAADRGQPADYDEWQRTGANGWGWDDVLPYFRKLERDLDFRGAPFHGAEGPIPIRRSSRAQWPPFANQIARSLERRGFRYIADYNADFGEGFAAVPTNCLPGRRVSASMAYLTSEVRSRANLTVLPDTQVRRVCFEGRRANGVEAFTAGKSRKLRSRQVIVCGGAIHSPALLMRSGVGPREHLARYGIDCVQNLAGVGGNLGNHPCITLTTYLRREAAQPPTSACFVQSWLRYSSRHELCEPNDMHLMAFNKYGWHRLGSSVGALTVSVLHTYSRGEVRLASADPDVPPHVHFNLLADPRDFERLVAGLRLALTILNEPRVRSTRHELFFPPRRLVLNLGRPTAWNQTKARAIKAVLDTPLRSLFMAAAKIDIEKLLSSENALRDFVSANRTMQFHVCGTCRMGADDDANAVVDSAGRVHGVEGLRITDASIFPTTPRGYTHLMVLMAAEKIADHVKTTWV
jgi:5-(hydroxymethyl)furfural/furfural oxidase